MDNTFMTGYLQKPLTLGADATVYSATKFYGGHADLNAGSITLNDTDLYNEFFFYQNTLGATLSPFDSYTLLRGIRTLAIRLDRQQENVAAVIAALKRHPAIDQVLYPGWYSPAEAAIQKKQARGFGAVISFSVKPSVDLGVFFEKLQLIDLAVSLGGVESLVCRPTTMTHAPTPRTSCRRSASVTTWFASRSGSRTRTTSSMIFLRP
ncbi:CysA [Schleiferilactobacillus shenzhenensis LY-73]|uniref:CysA n=1 Tax=Schleiferilactobacillus shenzhenensis LY-73 TaxID=1231336 RepID=U4TLF7_9LACO|nr:CysA [Schleiferilactobacillus shenzhenensis LY-73]